MHTLSDIALVTLGGNRSVTPSLFIGILVGFQ
jgi:hypothetical protein